MSRFPQIEIPDFLSISKSANWQPKKYQPMVYNEVIKDKAENLKPGTLAYDDFWDEMDYYCFNGFQPKGMPKITGRHFFYLNFCQIDLLYPGEKKKRLGNPFYRDLDHMLFLEMDAAIKYGYGLIVAKPRRVGLSEWGVVNMVYEMTFFARNKLGICAGKEDKAAEFYDKLKSSLSFVHIAYRSGTITNNSSELLLGYEETINKQKEKRGLLSLARMKTMFADSKAFEGGSYSIVVFEEIGLFENLNASYKATEPCFKEGAVQFGIPLLYGTGGEIDKGARGFKDMWDNHEAYNIKQIFIPAYYYFPGDGIPDKKTGISISFFNRATGVTNRSEAKKYIEAERVIASKAKETYTQHIQQYPLHAKEVFLKTKGGILDRIKLNFQLKEIAVGNEPDPVLQGRLDWIDEPRTVLLLQRAKNIKEKTKIRIAQGSKVEFKVDENGTIWKDSTPINPLVTSMGYKPDIGACDSYDELVDENNPTISSGCVMIYRCFSGPSRLYDKPVGLLYERGDASFDNDVFYENAVKMGIYWDCEILIEYTKFNILRYFYDVGADRYIRKKPELEQLGTNNHANVDGVKMTSKVKPEVTVMLKMEVKTNIHKCFFMNIILDLLDYGDKNTDIAMTYGIALIHKLDLFDMISEDIEVDHYGSKKSDMNSLHNYFVDTDGNLQISSFGGNDNSNIIDTFIPERDLDEYDYEKYIKEAQSKEKMLKKKQMDFEKSSDEKHMDLDQSILDMIAKERARYNVNN